MILCRVPAWRDGNIIAGSSSSVATESTQAVNRLFDCRSNRSSFVPACSPGIFPLLSRAWKSTEDYTTIQICKAAFTLLPKQETSSLHQASVGDTLSHVFCCLFGICKCSFFTSRPVAAGSLRLRCKLHVSGSPKPFLRRSGGRLLDSFSVSALLWRCCISGLGSRNPPLEGSIRFCIVYCFRGGNHANFRDLKATCATCSLISILFLRLWSSPSTMRVR